jgi:hypothetical protein
VTRSGYGRHLLLPGRRRALLVPLFQEDQQENPVRTLIAIAAATLVLSLPAPVATAGAPEYNRGYYDCLAGRYDDDDESRSYRQGCRAAEEEHGGDERPRYWRPDRGPPGPPPGYQSALGLCPELEFPTSSERTR